MKLSTLMKNVIETHYEIVVRDMADEENPYKSCEVNYCGKDAEEIRKSVSAMMVFQKKYAKADVIYIDINRATGALSIEAEIK